MMLMMRGLRASIMSISCTVVARKRCDMDSVAFYVFCTNQPCVADAHDARPEAEHHEHHCFLVSP